MGMLKYVSLRESEYLIPKETCLIIELSDESNETGTRLFIRELQRILESHRNITCVIFEGSDFKPELITYWVNYVYKHFKHLKIGWASNLDKVPSCIMLHKMDYIFLKDNLYRRDYDSKYKTFEKSWYLS